MKDRSINDGDISNIIKNIYINYYSQYDFLCLFDCDEFLELNEKYNNDINNYFDEPWFDNNECVLIHQQNYTSNGLLHYEDKSLKERFTETTDFDINLKAIINCNLIKPEKFNLYIKYYLNTSSYCFNDGQHFYIKTHKLMLEKYNCAKLNHYCVKSAEEYVERYLKNPIYYSKYRSANMYKKLNNNISDELLNYVAKYLPEI